MIKFAIVVPVEKTKDGKILYRPILEGEDGEFKRELASRVRRILGPKKSFAAGEVDRAISLAFDEYKMEFKERSVKLP